MARLLEQRIAGGYASLTDWIRASFTDAPAPTYQELLIRRGKHRALRLQYAARILGEVASCTHFNGLMNRTCRAGVVYLDLAGGSQRGMAIRLPCLGGKFRSSGDGERRVTCPLYAPPSFAEARREAHALRRHMREVAEKMARQECLGCGKTWEGRQVGPCVYCEHCGTRLYHGRITTHGTPQTGQNRTTSRGGGRNGRRKA